MNKDILYLLSLILVIINYILITHNRFKTKNTIINLILLLLIVYVAHYNIYLGFLLSITFLSLN